MKELCSSRLAGETGCNALPPMLWPLPLFAPGALVPDHSWRNYAGRVFNELRCSSRLAAYRRRRTSHIKVRES